MTPSHYAYLLIWLIGGNYFSRPIKMTPAPPDTIKPICEEMAAGLWDRAYLLQVDLYAPQEPLLILTDLKDQCRRNRSYHDYHNH